MGAAGAGLAYPIVVANLADQLSKQVTSMLVGHLSPVFLGASTMGMMFVNVTGISLCFGGMSSLDTLCSQAFGARNFHLVGTWAQRATLMLTFIMCPIIICVWLFASAPVFRLLGLDDETAELAADFCRLYCWGLWPMLMSRCIMGFLRSQRIVRPVMFCTGIASLITTGFCVWAVDAFGFYGAPLTGVRNFDRNLGKFDHILRTLCGILAYLTDTFGRCLGRG